MTFIEHVEVIGKRSVRVPSITLSVLGSLCLLCLDTT